MTDMPFWDIPRTTLLLTAADKELTAERRKRLRDKSFALPKTRQYPIHDKSHARNALSRVAQHGTREQQGTVLAAVYRKYPSLNPANK